MWTTASRAKTTATCCSFGWTATGDYFVVMFPRFRDQAAPQFTTLGEGTVIKLQGDAGTDYCFLPNRETTVTAEQAEFRGIAGSVQDRKGWSGVGDRRRGPVRYGDWALKLPKQPACAWPDRLTIHTIPDRREGGRVTVTAAGSWKLAESTPGYVLTAWSGASNWKCPPEGTRPS
jgi:hypothetical protein